jgi:4-amino-4-deoxy-L-arabinose transferase-like glycosyltransferase
LIVCLAVGGSASWAAHNVVLVGRDAAGHLQQSLAVADSLQHGLAPAPIREAVPNAVRGAFAAVVLDDYRPPGLYLLTAPAYVLFGRSPQTALLPNLLLLGAVIVLTYLLAREITGPPLALFAALLAGLLPMVGAMARLYYMETLLTAALLTAVLALLRSEGFTDRRWSLAWGLALGVMLLVKWTTPIYLLVPLLYILARHSFWAAQRRVLHLLPGSRPRRALLRALFALLLGGALALLWYLPNRAIVHAEQMPLGDWLPLLWTAIFAATLYGLLLPRRGPVANFWTAALLALAVASLWYLPRIDFLRRLSDVAFGTDRGNQAAWDLRNLDLYTRYFGFWVNDHMGPLAAALILPIAIVGWIILFRRRVWGAHWRTVPAPLAVYWLLFAGAWFFLTLLAQANPRNLTPLVPIAAILFALSLRAFPRPLAAAIAASWIAVLNLQWAIYTFDAGYPLHARTAALWARGDYLQWPARGSTDPGYWIHPDVLATIAAANHAPDRAAAPDEPDSFGILVNTWEVNRGAFRYLAALLGQDVEIMTLTEEENHGWSEVLANRWLLVKDGDNANVAAPGQAVIRGIYDPNARGHALFHQLYTAVQTYPLPNGDTATLYFRAAGPRQPFAYPVILNETAPIAANLNAWWSPGANVVFDTADTAVWLGLHNLRAGSALIAEPPTEPRPVSQAVVAAQPTSPLAHESTRGIAQGGADLPAATLQELTGTIFFLSRHDAADARAAIAEHSYLARVVQSGPTTLEVYGRPSADLAALPATQPWTELDLAGLRGLTSVPPGAVLPLELNASAKVDRPLKLSVRLVDAQNHTIAQNDVAVDPTQTLRFGLFIPPGVVTGPHRLEAILYDPATLVPIPTRAGTDAAALATIRIMR